MEICWFLRTLTVDGFSVDFLDAIFACGYSGVRVAAFFEKLAHLFTFVLKDGVVTTKAPCWSKKLRERNAFFHVLWMRGQI